jgi:hypothetical protein
MERSMRLGLVAVTVSILILPVIAHAGAVLEMRADTALVGTGMEPFDFPLGVSLAVLGEHSVREQVSIRIGLGCRILWSEESRDLFSPDMRLRPLCSLRDSGSNEGPLRFYGLQAGVRLGGSQIGSGSLVELGVGLGRSGRKELENDAFLSIGAGYAWRLSSGTEATLIISERAYGMSEHSEVSLAVGVGYLAR